MERQEKINAFLALRNRIDGITSDFMEFLKLKDTARDITEQLDLDVFHQDLTLALGSLNQAWDDLYIFNERLQMEALNGNQETRTA